MNSLVAADLLDRSVERVQAERRYRDIPGGKHPGRLFAVFEGDQFLALITERQAALFPERIFGDLAVLPQPEPVHSHIRLPQILEKLELTPIRGIPVLDEGGEFAGAISELSIFSALAHAESSLRAEKEKLIDQLSEEIQHHRIAAVVFDNTSEGILVTDGRFRVLQANDAFLKKMNYTRDGLLGKIPEILSRAHHDRDFYRTIRRQLDKQTAWSGQVWLRKGNDDVSPEWLVINSVSMNEGKTSHYVGFFSDISKQKKIKRNLHQLAYYDTLTGLANRQLFQHHLISAIKIAERYETRFALLFVDLDRFKDVNDSLGHAFGDKLLKEVAGRLKNAIRDGDAVARLGGDEFTVLLRGDNIERDCVTVAGRIAELFERPLDIDRHRIFVTASIGIAFYPTDGPNADVLMKSADAAMYRAKAQGRNRFCIYSQPLNQEATDRLYMANALHDDLREERLSIVWQPIVELQSGRVIGFEALSRWKHAVLGDVSPGKFIPLAEEVGLMEQFGAWNLKRIAHEIEALGEVRRRYPLSFAVNISAIQINYSNNLVQKIRAILEQTKLDPAHFIVEITETAFMKKEGSGEDVLAAISSLGVKIAIDDFGVGYSNLAYLKRFAVNRLKVDRSFIRDIADDPATCQIVSAIIQMAHGLNIEVVAEGVETEQQLKILQELGCDTGQGYLFGRPEDFHHVSTNKFE